MSEQIGDKELVDLPKADGLVALFDESEIHGYKIREWSISKFSILYPSLKIALKPLIEKGANLDNVESFIEQNWDSLLDALVPVASEIIKISCPEKASEVEELPWGQGCVIAACILKRNLEHIADFFAQFARGNEKPLTQANSSQDLKS